MELLVEVSDYVVSGHGMVVSQVFEDYYVREVLDYPSVKVMSGVGFQVGHRIQSVICS